MADYQSISPHATQGPPGGLPRLAESENLERPLVVALVSPAACGKTAYLAALRMLSTRAAVDIHGSLFRLRGFRGLGLGAEAAEEALDQVVLNLLDQSRLEQTELPLAYQFALERLGPSFTRARRQVTVIDSQGGLLFPGLRQSVRSWNLPDDISKLSDLLEGLGLADAEVCVLAFVNQPQLGVSSSWSMHDEVPSALAYYIDGQPIDRLAYFVGCADTLFPRLHDLRPVIDRLNGRAESPACWTDFGLHFQGSPHSHFALSFLRYLQQQGHLQVEDGWPAAEFRPKEVRFGMFWGSSFGVVRRAGTPNVRDDGHGTMLLEPERWLPLGVLEPLVWAAGLDSQQQPALRNG